MTDGDRAKRFGPHPPASAGHVFGSAPHKQSRQNKHTKAKPIFWLLVLVPRSAGNLKSWETFTRTLQYLFELRGLDLLESGSSQRVRRLPAPYPSVEQAPARV